MPTSGTRYYRYDSDDKHWQQVYAENIPKTQKKKIVGALNRGLDESGWRPKKTWGELIEDRESQITLSILGQQAPIEEKEKWDPSGSKKLKLREIIAPLIPEFEVRAAGTTSIDVTKPGIDKAYGVQKLLNLLSINKQDVLFIGDKLIEGGNDYPVKAMGIDCMEISKWQETALVIEAILFVSWAVIWYSISPMATPETINASHATGYAERFDEMFAQLELIAQIPQDIKNGNPTITRENVGTRLTPERMIGTTVLHFVIFSSDTKYRREAELLYTPSITLFLVDSKEALHVKRRNLTVDPSNTLAQEKIAEFEKIERYFSRYVGDAGSEIDWPALWIFQRKNSLPGS